MSQAVRHRYTRTLAGKWIMRATLPAPCVMPADPRPPRFVAARPWPAPTPDPARSQPAAAPVRFPPTRIASAAFPGAASATGRTTVPSAPVLHKTPARTSRSALARQSARANTPFATSPCFLRWLFSSCHHYAAFQLGVEEGFVGRLRLSAVIGQEELSTAPKPSANSLCS